MYHNDTRYIGTRCMIQGGNCMVRKPVRKDKRFTNPDHRPMLPEFRMPGDNLDTTIREARRRFQDVNPEHNKNWR